MTEQTPTKRAICKVVYKIDSALKNSVCRESWFLPICGIVFLGEAIFNILSPYPLFNENNIIFNLTNLLMSIFFTTFGTIMIITKFIKIKIEDYLTSDIVIILFCVTSIPMFVCLTISFYLIKINIMALILTLFTTLVFASLFGIFIYLSSWCPKLKGV